MPGLVSCLRVLIVIGLLLLLSPVNSQSEIWTNEVSDVQYGRLGSNVTLECSVAPGRSSVEWRLNRSSALPWQHHVTSDGHLVLLHADHAAEGNYSCYDNQGLLIQTVRLQLGHPPGLLSVSCRVPNHNLVFCSWVESVKTHLPAQYHASYRDRNQVMPCDVSPPPQQRCTITGPTMWQPYHDINITETNPLGTQTTVVRLRFDQLLKPDPPEAVTAEGVVGFTRRLQVNWRPPASWPNDSGPFPLHVQLQYRPVGSKVWSTVETMDSHLLITDALEATAHHLQVRVQDGHNPDSQWSDWSPVQQASPWTRSTVQPTEVTPADYETDATTTPKPENLYEEGGNLGVVVLLALFAGIILALVSSLFVLMWMRHRGWGNRTKQELTSMVKMKSMPI
ncbi:interleukin-11 receptor subunit alpha [Esox lucius]|uniref:interleukin-11 receptor subunit alpha n=1 Tax=Esox lucius TaxID=8010 RepID=UPI000576CF28|nr:interleukin-11 receptor subunit alpha [Esox lucius]